MNLIYSISKQFLVCESGLVIDLGIRWEEGWILMVATTTKVFIDVFIGVWAFILAVVWCVFGIDRTKTRCDKVSAGEIWERFPKFIIGFALTFILLLLLGLKNPSIVKAATVGANQANTLRTFFFALCFFSIGLITNVRKLWAAGMGRIVGVYVICLFGFIFWFGLFVSWLFYHGIMPPVIAG